MARSSEIKSANLNANQKLLQLERDYGFLAMIESLQEKNERAALTKEMGDFANKFYSRLQNLNSYLLDLSVIKRKHNGLLANDPEARVALGLFETLIRLRALSIEFKKNEDESASLFRLNALKKDYAQVLADAKLITQHDSVLTKSVSEFNDLLNAAELRIRLRAIEKKFNSDNRKATECIRELSHLKNIHADFLNKHPSSVNWLRQLEFKFRAAAIPFVGNSLEIQKDLQALQKISSNSEKEKEALNLVELKLRLNVISEEIKDNFSLDLLGQLENLAKENAVLLNRYPQAENFLYKLYESYFFKAIASATSQEETFTLIASYEKKLQTDQKFRNLMLSTKEATPYTYYLKDNSGMLQKHFASASHNAIIESAKNKVRSLQKLPDTEPLTPSQKAFMETQRKSGAANGRTIVMSVLNGLAFAAAAVAVGAFIVGTSGIGLAVLVGVGLGVGLVSGALTHRTLTVAQNQENKAKAETYYGVRDKTTQTVQTNTQAPAMPVTHSSDTGVMRTWGVKKATASAPAQAIEDHHPAKTTFYGAQDSSENNKPSTQP